MNKYNEEATTRHYANIERVYTEAVKHAVKNGNVFWTTQNRGPKTIGIIDAVKGYNETVAVTFAMSQGITAGFHNTDTNNIHADFVIGRKIGARLRKLVP